MYFIDTATGAWGGTSSLQFVPEAAVDTDEISEASDGDICDLGNTHGLTDEQIIESVIDDNYADPEGGEEDVLQSLLDSDALTAQDVRSLMAGVLAMVRG